MSTLRNLLVLGSAICLSCSVYATTETKNAAIATQSGQSVAVTPIKVNQDQVKEKTNINTATVEDLEKVKYFGKKKARAVVDYRAANGEFKSLDDILKVKFRGMTKKWLDKVSANLTI